MFDLDMCTSDEWHCGVDQTDMEQTHCRLFQLVQKVISWLVSRFSVDYLIFEPIEKSVATRKKVLYLDATR